MIITLCLNPVIQRTLVFPMIAAGSVNRALQNKVTASGKGINVSRVVHQLGVPVRHITQAGGQCGDWFLHMAQTDGICVQPVPTHADIRFCTTVIDTSAVPPVVTELVEEGNRVEPDVSSAVSVAVDAALKQASSGCTVPRKDISDIILQTDAAGTNEPDNLKINLRPVLVISGSKAPGFLDTIFPSAAESAVRHGAAVVADIRGPDLTALMERCRNTEVPYELYIKPNDEEFAATFHCTRSEVPKKMADVCRTYGCSAIITRGSKSVLAFHNGTSFDIPVVPSQKSCNTTGCGDSFAAGFAAACAAGASFERSVQAGIMCGNLNAESLLPGSLM